MTMQVSDFRKREHKGTHVLFWRSFIVPYHRCDVFSSLRSALKKMRSRSVIDQSLHDVSGRLIAYAEDGEVVMCHA